MEQIKIQEKKSLQALSRGYNVFLGLLITKVLEKNSVQKFNFVHKIAKVFSYRFIADYLQKWFTIRRIQ